MYNPTVVSYTLFDTITPQTLTSSTDATPIVVTKTAHGYSTGDVLAISGHTTNVAANGIRRITVVTANTFSLQDPVTNANIAGSGAGAGSNGIAMSTAKVVNVDGFRRAVVSFITAGTATLTMKFAGSTGKSIEDLTTTPYDDTPNMGGTLTDTNYYNFLSYTNLDTVASGLQVVTAGATGIAASGTDLNITVSIDITGLKYFALLPTAFTQGSVSAKLRLYSD